MTELGKHSYSTRLALLKTNWPYTDCSYYRFAIRTHILFPMLHLLLTLWQTLSGIVPHLDTAKISFFFIFTTALTFALFCSVNASLIPQQSKFIDCLLLRVRLSVSRLWTSLLSQDIFYAGSGTTANVNASYKRTWRKLVLRTSFYVSLWFIGCSLGTLKA